MVTDVWLCSLCREPYGTVWTGRYVPACSGDASTSVFGVWRTMVGAREVARPGTGERSHTPSQRESAIAAILAPGRRWSRTLRGCEMRIAPYTGAPASIPGPSAPRLARQWWANGTPQGTQSVLLCSTKIRPRTKWAARGADSRCSEKRTETTSIRRRIGGRLMIPNPG